MDRFGQLDVVSPEFIATLAGLAAFGWGWLWRRRRRRRAGAAGRRSATIGLVSVSVLLTVSTVASCVNSYFSYLPMVNDVVDVLAASPPPDVHRVLASTPPASRSTGTLVRLAVPDTGSGFGPSTALVWLPPQYFQDPTQRFRVAYLFHGSPGTAKDWYRGGKAGRIGLELASQGKPVILVAPQMSHHWLDDPECVDGVRERIETHLLSDVIPAVDGSLRTLANRDGRIFAGMSAGGYCALNLGLRNRGTASTILDLSGFTRPTHSGGLKALFGQADSAAVAQNTPAQYASSFAPNPRMRIWLDCGSGDRGVLAELRAIAPVLTGRGFTVVLRVRPGEHTYSVWRPALHDALGWALSDSV